MDKVQQIIKLTCERFEMTEATLMSKTRRRQVVMARYSAMKLMYEQIVTTVTEIGLVFKQDHSTVSHGLRAVQDFIDTDKKFKEFFLHLESEVKEAIGDKPDGGVPRYVWQKPLYDKQLLFI